MTAVGDPKGERRDHWQVYANGGIAALGALAGFARSSPGLGLWLVTTALAAAAADTWATSTGRFSPTPPRLLGLGQIVPPGTNGGMTATGSAGALAGALLVAATGAFAAEAPLLLPAATLIGFLGMVADSALGARLQGRFTCPACRQPSEWRTHRCGAPTVHQGGVRWLTNDGVNFLATALAGALGLAAWAWRCS